MQVILQAQVHFTAASFLISCLISRQLQRCHVEPYAKIVK